MKRKEVAFCVTVLAVLILGAIIIALAQTQNSTMPPCEFEDSTNCIWDASRSGNGLGESFMDIGGKRYAI